MPPTDRPLSMAQFKAMEEQAKWEEGHERRMARHDNSERRERTAEAILEAKARELGVQCTIGHPEIRQSLPFRLHAVDVSPEVVLQVDLRGHYAYATIARRGAYRGRFTPEEIHLLVEQLRSVRLPYRSPHVSKSKKGNRRG